MTTSKTQDKKGKGFLPPEVAVFLALLVLGAVLWMVLGPVFRGTNQVEEMCRLAVAGKPVAVLQSELKERSIRFVVKVERKDGDDDSSASGLLLSLSPPSPFRNVCQVRFEQGRVSGQSLEKAAD